MIRRPPRSTLSSSSAASDVYKRQYQRRVRGASLLEMMVGEEGGENVVHFEGLDQRVDAVFGGLGGAGDWKLASTVRLDPGHEKPEDQPSQESKQCSISALDVAAMASRIRAVVFDLDACCWDPEMYQLWGGGAPFKHNRDNTLTDRSPSLAYEPRDYFTVISQRRGRSAPARGRTSHLGRAEH
eukprot:TRINITY_DN6026_c0_g2_i2.p2 TRINITY_DN6026_c0_g2~~TRINITY_DN6026_c0_g2_i2.p2  ORF type:complete len:184 (-),score=40.00 TRINITY_DN6026_c0_g2_i2:451-1002(-)